MPDALRRILHVDMDAFFASVEQRDRPELRGRPVLVGGASRRGVVAAASYEARPFGARSAMPMANALRLCPDAVVVPARHRRYAEVSASVFTIFRRYTPLVEGLSLDEAFLDVTGSRALFGDGAAIARRIKDEITAELQLTASAGVAPCKFAAKIASDLDKPDGLTVVGDDVAAFLAPLPIERMWGVGPAAAARLRALGLSTLGALAGAETDRLQEVLGNWASQARALARGEDSREVVPERAAKSIGSEETFEQDLTTRAELERSLLGHAQGVAQRLSDAGQWAQVVRIKVKYSDFTLRTRQAQLPEPVMDTDSIFAAARSLIDELPRRRDGIRLAGVAVAQLSAGPAQTSLFTDAAGERRQRLQRAQAELRGRFGEQHLTRATLLDPVKPRRKR